MATANISSSETAQISAAGGPAPASKRRADEAFDDRQQVRDRQDESRRQQPVVGDHPRKYRQVPQLAGGSAQEYQANGAADGDDGVGMKDGKHD